MEKMFFYISVLVGFGIA